MSQSTPQQYGRVYAALKMLKLGEDFKKDMVFSYTQDPDRLSLKDLDHDQCHDLIMKLNALVSPSTAAAEAAPIDPDKEACNKIRRRIIAICHNMGWYRYENGIMVLKDGQKQIDYDRIDRFCVERTAAKKRMNKMDKAELQKTAAQFEILLKQQLK